MALSDLDIKIIELRYLDTATLCAYSASYVEMFNACEVDDKSFRLFQEGLTRFHNYYLEFLERVNDDKIPDKIVLIEKDLDDAFLHLRYMMQYHEVCSLSPFNSQGYDLLKVFRRHGFDAHYLGHREQQEAVGKIIADIENDVNLIVALSTVEMMYALDNIKTYYERFCTLRPWRDKMDEYSRDKKLLTDSRNDLINFIYCMDDIVRSPIFKEGEHKEKVVALELQLRELTYHCKDHFDRNWTLDDIGKKKKDGE